MSQAVPPGRSGPHKLVSRDFSTRNTSPREATGLMSWVCCSPPSSAPQCHLQQRLTTAAGPRMEPRTSQRAAASPGMSPGTSGTRTSGRVGSPPTPPRSPNQTPPWGHFTFLASAPPTGPHSLLSTELTPNLPRALTPRHRLLPPVRQMALGDRASGPVGESSDRAQSQVLGEPRPSGRQPAQPVHPCPQH